MLTVPSKLDTVRYMAKYNKQDMRDLMAVLKALADENRVRILGAVQQRELCVCQIVELLGLAQSTVSKHVAVLHQARLVESRNEGRWMYYRAADADSPVEARQMAAVVTNLLGGTPEAGEDMKRMKRILKIDREELCRKRKQC
jgi:DNA-binding transcriptional ArsR family regulator